VAKRVLLGSKFRGAIRWVSRKLFPLWIIVWLGGIVLRLTLRDSIEIFAPLYYCDALADHRNSDGAICRSVWRSPKMVFGCVDRRSFVRRRLDSRELEN
jgi:hypothetical protein